MSLSDFSAGVGSRARLTAALAAGAGFYAACLWWLDLPQEQLRWISYAYWTIAPGAAGLKALAVARHADPDERPAWRWLGRGWLLWALGTVLWAAVDREASPGLGDVAYGLAAVLMMVGIYRYGSEAQVPGVKGLQATNLLIVLIALSFCVALVALRAERAFDTPPGSAFVSLAYPIIYLTPAVFGTLCLGVYSSARKRRIFLLLLLVAACLSLAGWGYGWDMLSGGYQHGAYHDFFWAAGFMLAYAAAAEVRGDQRRNLSPDNSLSPERIRLVQHCMPAIAVALILLVALTMGGETLPEVSAAAISAATVLAFCFGAHGFFSFRVQSELHDRAFAAQARLAASESERHAALLSYKTIFEQTQDPICITDADGGLVDANPRLCELLGQPADRLIGRPIHDLVPEEDAPRTREAMARARDQGLAEFESPLVGSDGRIRRLMWSAVWTEPNRRIFAVGRDITERLRVEEERRQSAQLNALGQLTGGVAHDFNNVLTVVLGNAEAIVNDPSVEDQTRELAGSILDASERAADLIDRLLSFARRQSLTPEPVDVAELFQEAKRLMDRTLGAQVSLTIAAEAGSVALADASQLHAAIVNLCLNARDAMGGDGRIELSARAVSLRPATARRFEVAPGRYVEISVRDDGAGIDSAVLPRVFEPFFTTKGTGKGSGLGLSMVYGFAKQSGGHAVVASAKGAGTTVTLYLPRADRALPRRRAGSTHLPGGSEHVLVVEDDDEVRAHVERSLGRLGYRVTSAASGEAALARLRLDPSIHLVFTDVVMPGMNGAELVLQARAMRPGLRVLFTSGYSDEAVAGYLGPGANLLPKPYRRPDLAARLRRALA